MAGGRNSRSKSKQPEKLDVTRCSTPVTKYMTAIEKKLSKDQKHAANNVIDRTNNEMIEWVGKQTLIKPLAQFNQYEVLEKLCDQLTDELSDIPRDYFRCNLWYKLNGIRRLVEQKRDKLASAPSTTSAAAHTEPEKQDNAVVTEHNDEDAEHNDEDNADDEDADRTVVENTQHYVQSATPPAAPDTQSPAPSAPAPPTRLHCVTWCIRNREQGDLPMTRCCTCMSWFHVLCTDHPEDRGYAADSSWTCPRCREIPLKITQLQKDMSSVKDLPHKIEQLQNDMTRVLQMLATLTSSRANSVTVRADVHQAARDDDSQSDNEGSENESDSDSDSDESEDDDESETEVNEEARQPTGDDSASASIQAASDEPTP